MAQVWLLMSWEVLKSSAPRLDIHQKSSSFLLCTSHDQTRDVSKARFEIPYRRVCLWWCRDAGPMGHHPRDEKGPCCVLWSRERWDMWGSSPSARHGHGTTGPWFWQWIVMRLLQTLTHLAAGHSPWVTMNRIRCISGCTTPLEPFDVSYTYDSLETASLN